MELEFKTDFEQARQRWDRFWKGEVTDRPMTRIVIRKPGKNPVYPHPYNLPRHPLEPMIDQVLEWAESFEWLGDAIPGYSMSFAPDHFSLLLGADMVYSGNTDSGDAETGWIVPFLKDYDQEIRFRPDCAWWEKTVEYIRAFRKRCDGKLVIYGTHFQGGLDALAAIRDAQELLMDLVLRPDDVKRALRQIDCAIDDARRALAEEIGTAEFGCLTRHGTYSGTGLTDVPQCDFSAMISPEMFREFGLPSLKHECDMLAGVVYHLDGPDAIRHLTAVAEIEKVKMIQWVPGAGEAAKKDWAYLFQQIDDLGLGNLHGGNTDTVKQLCRKYRSRRYLYIHNVYGITCQHEAEEFLDTLGGSPSADVGG
jgi:5-methyltetrahydrofolate--homocysteine methyltransferase